MKKLLVILLFFIPLVHGMETTIKKKNTLPSIIRSVIGMLIRKEKNVQLTLFSSKDMPDPIAEEQKPILHLLHAHSNERWSILPLDVRKEIVGYIIALVTYEMELFLSMEKYYNAEEGLRLGHNKEKALKVIAYVEQKRFSDLQKTFDDCERRGDRSSNYDNPYSYLVKHLENKNSMELEDLFDSLPHEESILKMALRMVYGKKIMYLRQPEDTGEVEKSRKRSRDLDFIEFYSFFNSGGIHGKSICLAEDWRFHGTLKKHLKDFLALLQSMGFRELSILYIQDNGLFQLPETLAWFNKLRIIALSGNKFKEVPHVIKQCKNLEDLRLDRNPIRELPLWIVECGWKKLEITIDKDVVVPWNENEHKDIKIVRE